MTGNSIFSTHLLLAPNRPAILDFMARQGHSFSHQERLWFFCYGNLPTQAQISSLQKDAHKKKIILLYENDLLGRITAIKIAAWLKNRNIQISYQPGEMIRIRFNGKTYLFPESKLSLSRFEKCSGFRSQLKTYQISN